METGNLIAKLATNSDELEASKILRHRIFRERNNESFDQSSNSQYLDYDGYDKLAEHIVIIDRQRLIDGSQNYVVGTCRLIIGDFSDGPNHFYSNSEFMIESLVKFEKRFLELGRTCLDPKYRDGRGLYLLWLTFLRYISENKIEIVFGVASFKGVSPEKFAHALSFLHYHHLSQEKNVTARSEGFVALNQLSKEDINLRKAHKQLPSLLKTYLSCGGWVGKGAFLDKVFETLDIFVSVEASDILRKYKIS